MSIKTLHRFRKWLLLPLLIHHVLLPAFYGVSNNHGLEGKYFQWRDGAIILSSVIFLYTVIHAVCGHPDCYHRLVRCSLLIGLVFLNLHLFVSFIENRIEETIPRETFRCEGFINCRLKWTITFLGILNCILLVSEALLTINYSAQSVQQEKFRDGDQTDIGMVMGREQP